ncbi:MAG: chorismate synthase, partial [Clostridia bacterium]|nr:chorismate synthase [Clostridia bacterium]
AGDSVGGEVEVKFTGLPVGIGDALFDGLDGHIAHAVFAVPAVKGIAFGRGFAAASLLGSENNDPYRMENGRVVTLQNASGGVLGGMSSGMPLLFTAAIKPTPSIFLPQDSVNLQTNENTVLTVKGRHDPCIVPRAVAPLMAAAALAILDLWEET